jgi:hypothetical protein
VSIQEEAEIAAERLRRRLVAVIVVLAMILGLLLLYVHTRPSPPQSASVPTPQATPEQLLDVLRRQAAALVAGDEGGWLAPLAPDGRLFRQYEDLYHRLRTLGVTSMQPVISPYARAGTTVSYGVCTQTLDCPTAEAGPPTNGPPWTETFEITLDAIHTVDGHIQITTMIVTPPAPVSHDYFTRVNRAQPYLEGADLRMRSGRRTTAFAPPALAGELARVVAAGDAAALTDDRYAYWTRPTRYLVYLAGPAEWQNWFNGQPQYGGEILAYAINDSRSSDIVVVNDARARASGLSLETLLQHEFGHVVTLLGAQSDIADNVLTEGLAEYIAYDGQPLSDFPRLGDLGYYLNIHRWNGDPMSLDDSIYSDDTVTASAAYAIGFLTWRCIAARYGPARTRTFMSDAVHEQQPVDYSAHDAFGVSWAQVNRACAPFIRGAAG